MPLTLRRQRLSPHTRELTRDVTLDHRKFIQPLFVGEGLKTPEAVPGLGETKRDSEDSVLKQIEMDLARGVSKFLLFGVPASKKESGFRYDSSSKVIASIKKHFGDQIWLATDVCLCSFTTHGQCGILSSEGNHLENDSTVSELAKAATQYAQAGADCVAPSDMMDGRIRTIREALTKSNLDQTLLMSYSAKFHSKFYGPFRVAADSAPKGGGLKDRATYQIDPANAADALASSLRDAQEGADILMVKPGMPYLDILQTLSQTIHKPWAVYEVSGEFAGIELLAEKNLMNREAGHLEAWTALFRAGANMIISYGARHAKEWISK